MNDKRVAIIGAGPSGTAALRAFQSAKQKGAEIPEVVCFEKQGDVGGLWNFSWRTGLDGNGEPVHNSMYRYLWSNGPKEVLEFADYTFEEHFGKPIPSFPPREVLFDYIKGRVTKADVKKWCRFNTTVRNVTYDDKTALFTLVSRDLTTQEETKETFDWIICATGHFSVPNVPYFPGFEMFEGRVLHAHDFRNANEFSGKDLLIIGTSYSAEDIASQCYKYGCKTVTCSWRTNPMGWHWPESFSTVPLLTKVEGKTAFFKDGTSKEVDAIILCTGYQHHFPFLGDDLRLRTANRLWPDNLDKGIFWKNNPKMMYLGMQDQWYTFNMFDSQAWYARDYILGRITLPDAAAREAEFNAWREREGTLSTDEENITFQADYVESLMSATDYPSFDIKATIKEFMAWEHNKHEDIMTFRDCSHTSVMTGTLAPKHHTTWLKALDDSMKCYLQTE